MSGLPGSIDPIKLAERGARLTGTLPLAGMPRLAGQCLEGRGEVQVDLEFGRRERDNRRVMAGKLRVVLMMSCARCLEPVEIRLEANPELVLNPPGEGGLNETDSADSLVVDQPLDLNQLVEDELLLAMPMYPAHPAGQCPAGDVTGVAGQEKRNNPFAVLKSLKGGQDKRKR